MEYIYYKLGAIYISKKYIKISLEPSSGSSLRMQNITIQYFFMIQS